MISLRKKDRERVVAITGAGTGIGLALARKLYDAPYRTIVTARASSLERFAQAGLHETSHFLIRALDIVSDSERRAFFDEICRKWGGIDILINNAGLTMRAVMEDIDAAEEIEQFNVNYFGPMELTRLALPAMRRKRAGRIINISSVGGMMAMPTMGPYSASKFAMEGASEALWYEMRPWGVHVTLVQPGFVHSESFRNARLTARARRSSHDTDCDYHAYYANMLPFIEKMMMRSPTTPDDIADMILRTMRKKQPPLRLPVTPDAWFFFFIRKFLPRRLYHHILYRGLPGISRWVAQSMPGNSSST